jgi:hypothetical protein
MFPELLVLTIVILPEFPHEGQQVVAAVFLQNAADVGVLARFIAVLRVRAVAVIWP